MNHAFHILRHPFAVALLAGGLALAGCTTPAAGPVEVTRFARPELTASPRGAVALIAAPGTDGGGIAYTNHAGAVGRELARLGYAPRAEADVIAEVAVERAESLPSGRGNPVSVGLGGSTGGYGSGVGVGLGINLSGPPPRMVETRLAVTLRDRVSGLALWEGRAHGEVRADSGLADSPAGADRLARALFQGFPGRSGETITVR